MAAKKKAPKGWSGESLDIEGVSTEPPPPLPRGIYKAEIVEAEPHTSQKGGASISVTLAVHTRYGEPDGALEGKQSNMYDFLGFEGFGLRKLKQVCVQTEVQAPKEITEESAAAFCAEILGKHVWLRSKLEANQDRQGNLTGDFSHKVDRYLKDDQCAAAAESMAGNVTETAAADDAPVQRRAGKRRAA